MGVAELGDEPLATGSEPPCNMLQNHPAIQQRPKMKLTTSLPMSTASPAERAII